MKAAVIGAGHISRQHIACLREMPDVDVAAVCDLSPGVAEATCERFGVSRWFVNHKEMLSAVAPDVVHVATPPTSHFRLAADALEAGAHVILEKPATVEYEELTTLIERAAAKRLHMVEDYNYLFNRQVLQILDLVRSGAFGDVVHVDILIAVQILARGSPFADPNAPHPCTRMAGGAIADFLPHLASLAHAFVGEHQAASAVWQKRGDAHPLPSDEFRALVRGATATAGLAFSAHAVPETFTLQVHGTRMRARANLFETEMTLDRVRAVPRPLMPLLNGLDNARRMRRASYGSLWRKLGGGPGAYEGLWELLRRTYASIASDERPPVTPQQMEAVNRLTRDLNAEARSL